MTSQLLNTLVYVAGEGLPPPKDTCSMFGVRKLESLLLIV